MGWKEGWSEERETVKRMCRRREGRRDGGRRREERGNRSCGGRKKKKKVPKGRGKVSVGEEWGNVDKTSRETRNG